MKDDPQPLVSVLTPVYNGERHLEDCIQSVLAQSYQNWEYCIVNNCSTDRTLEIAQRYAERDKRIRIHNNETFVGCDANGNVACQQISPDSKYCKVVHADDWLFPECIAKMVELAEANPTVTIVGSYGLRNERVAWDGIPHSRFVIPGREICRSTLLGGPYVFGSPTSLLIRSNEVRKRPTFYNEANRHCDIEVCLDILRDSDFGFAHQVLTFTRDHSGSETAFSSRFGSDYLAALEHCTKYGKHYLSETEYSERMKQCWNRYYQFLGYYLIYNKKETGFWEFHRNELRRLGYRLSKGEVAKAGIAEILDLALNPLMASRKIVHRIRRLLQTR
jgi:glycosyltransferase involved in cell wall biosynthesis